MSIFLQPSPTETEQQFRQRVDQNFRRLEIVLSALPVVGERTPENFITASPGKLFVDTTGGAGTTFYVKETGHADTGWAAK